MGEFDLLGGTEDEQVEVKSAEALIGGVNNRLALRGEGGVVVIDVVVRDLEETAAIFVDHADLVVIAARASEDDASAVNAGWVRERGMRRERAGCVGGQECGINR